MTNKKARILPRDLVTTLQYTVLLSNISDQNRGLSWFSETKGASLPYCENVFNLHNYVSTE